MRPSHPYIHSSCVLKLSDMGLLAHPLAHLLTHTCASRGGTHTHTQVSSWVESQGSTSSNRMLIFPFLPVKPPAPLSEAAPGAGSHTCERQQLEGWLGSVISTWWPCPRSGIPRRWMRDNIMPTVDCASPPALRFLGRVAPVCKSSRLGSGPDLSSQWPWGRECLWTHIPTGLGQLLSCESPHMDPCFSPVTRCIYLGSYWAFPTLTLSSELQTTGAVTLGLDSKPWRSFQAHKLSNAVIFFLFLKVKV